MNSNKINQSYPPLRWIANLAGWISTKAIWEISLIEEKEEKQGLKYKFFGFLYDNLFPFYYKYGTHYKFDFDMSGPEWDDYDENGIPYWEKLGVVDPDYNPWNEDPITGDAWRIIHKG